MKRFKAVALFGLLGVSTVSLAEDLLQVMDLAKASDPSFRGAGFERQAVAETVKQARARLLPSLSFTYEDMDSDQTIVNSTNNVYNAAPNQSFDTTTDTLTLSQSIFNYEYWMRYGQSKAAKTRSDFEFETAYQDLLLRVGEAYFEQLKAREQLSAIALEKKALKQHLNYAQKSYKAGLGRQAEVSDAEARWLSSVAQDVEYQKLFGDAKYNLMEIIGDIPNALYGIEEDLPLISPEPADVNAWIEQGLQSNPDIKAAREQLKEARFEIKAQTSGHLPTVSLTYQDYTQEQTGSLYGGGSEVEQEDVTITFELPIYQGGAVSSRRREAIQRMYKAQEDITKVTRSIKNQAQSAYQGVVSNIAQIRALKQAVVAQKSVLQNKQKGYQSGLYSIIAVLDAQQDLAKAQQNYIAARNDYAINYIRLKRAAGVLIDADLALINSWLKAS